MPSRRSNLLFYAKTNSTDRDAFTPYKGRYHSSVEV